MNYPKSEEYHELKKKIRKKHLTRKDFCYVMRKKIDIIHFKEICDHGLVIPRKNEGSIMLIRASDSREEQKKTMIHEATHFIYGIKGMLLQSKEGIEDLLEKETERFYNKYTNFINLYFKHMLKEGEIITSPQKLFDFMYKGKKQIILR